MELTVLMENEGREGLAGSHGLSVWVQGADGGLLFDTGPDGAFLENAAKLGVDLPDTGAVVLSHNHWDHTGGLRALLERLDRKVTLYTGADFFRDKYAMDGGSSQKLSYTEEKALTGLGAELVTVGKEPLPLGGGLYLLGGFDCPCEFEGPGGSYVIEVDGGYVADPFADEIALVYEGAEELTMLSGCAHPGVAGMAGRAVEIFGKPVHTLLGGVHLADASEERVVRTAEALYALGVRVLGLAHCSGKRIGEIWAEKYGYVAGFHAGDRVVIEVV